MKVLLDTCVWEGARTVVQVAGHDVVWAGDWPEDPGDEEILARAHAEGRVLVTLDKDFGELAVARAKPHCGIVRLVGFSARLQGAACVDVLRRFGSELTTQAIVTAQPGFVRVRIANDPT